MTALRSLLRLEDKVAAEGRRLERIGGPPLGHMLPLVIVAAVLLHGAVLLLPALKTHASLPASSPPQDFPLVWRMASPAPVILPVPDRAKLGPAGRSEQPPPVTRVVGPAQGIEPVSEPPPEFGVTSLAVTVDAVIPPPDAPPPSLEPGLPYSASPPSPPSPPAQADAPALVHRVPPVYPVLARALRAEAQVTVRLTLAADGGVSDASVMGCTRPGLGFEAAAVEAVKRWHYEPEPAPSGPRTVIVTVEFKRQEARP